MSRAKLKAKKSVPTICEEKFACVSDRALPVVQCYDCGTVQCADCDEELHKEGDSFFHERVQINSLSAAKIEESEVTKKKVAGNNQLCGTPTLKLTLNPPSAGKLSGITPTLPAYVSACHKNNVRVQQQNPPMLVTPNQGTADNRGSDRPVTVSAGAAANSSTSRANYVHDSTFLSRDENYKQPTHQQFDYQSESPPPLTSLAHVELESEYWVPEDLEDSEPNSSEFHSLGLDSILSSEFTTDSDMRGQSSKPSKKTKSKKSGSTLIQDTATFTNHSTVPVTQQPYDDFMGGPPCVNGDVRAELNAPLSDAPPNEFPVSDADGDEELVSNLIRSVQLDNHSTPKGSKSGGHTTETRSSSTLRSFMLINESETIQVGSGQELLQRLGCAGADVKVVSIFGNTGDGKSYTLNHAFFNGEEVFATSADQATCTVGVWTAYDPYTKVMCIDTEGLLGITSNQNKRTRLLLKILAVSDVIIYRTSADRLHTDLFQFLGDASQAYSKHFKVELEARKAPNGHKLIQDMGPAVLVFHETTRTNTLDKSEGGKTGDELLRERFVSLDVDMCSFSSIKYVGVKTTTPPTNFSRLIASLKKEIANSSVRSPRSPLIIYQMLKILNDKFKGDIYSHSPNSFPDEFFTCASKCLACTSRCALSMNHKAGHFYAAGCKYVHAYDNRSYICKKCLQRGRKNEVVPKTCASDDNSIMGVAKYVLAGYVLECRECGVIYKSREHWYGNKDPTETAVQIEIKHIWPGQAAMPTGTHNAAWKLLDGVKVVADTVSAYSSKPTKVLSDWVADQVAPSYWVPNNEVMECHNCHHVFGEQEKKHHCRGCGSGFCDDCTQFTKAVPERGWGPTHVRVCEKCHNLPPGAVALGEERGPGDNNSLVPRQIVENVQSVLGAVASVAIDYPIEVIKDSARPAYWIPDHLIKTCHQCQAEFGPKLTIHHCRACGHGVCSSCSANKRQVSSRGWDRPVRVCDACYSKDGAL